MSVKLGTIELTRLQSIEIDEGRNLVEHRLPGGSGSVFQDLGRRAIRLRMRGLLLGETALEQIETLRKAHAEATPLQFVADIVVGTELTDVMIDDFEVQQVPGYTFRYEFTLQVQQWTEPPEPPAAAIAAVNLEVGFDAASWGDQALALAGVLDSPAGLAGLLGDSPNLLARVDAGELGQAVVGALGGLNPSDFGHLLSAVSGVDPNKAIAFVEGLAAPGNIADVFNVLASSGLDFLQDLAGVDLSSVSNLVKGLLGGPEFLAKFDKVREAAQALVDEVTSFDPLAATAPLAGGPSA